MNTRGYGYNTGIDWAWTNGSSTADTVLRYFYGSGTTVTSAGYSDRVTVVHDTTLKPGKTYELPDGAKLVLDANGNYQLQDDQAKVVYKANRLREFSPHLVASDQLALFVKYAHSLGVPAPELMQLPLQLFVNWLLIEAAERDGDDVSDVPQLSSDPRLRQLVRPKCLTCGKFIPRRHQQHNFMFCNPQEAASYLRRTAGAAPVQAP